MDVSGTSSSFPRISVVSYVDVALLEKHREKQKPAHFALLDLEKAVDRVPRDAIWSVLRQQGVPQELIEWVRILYSCPLSRVRAPANTSMEFPITAVVHQTLRYPQCSSWSS
ncbi:unnamed protein product [Heligmosomoides polygyrus]|uniref:Reverse transcriptase domain-containing protein n=1 Tax=Heligmosomoides polygyrus TaxID=6339 RepID=A0A183G0U3_HELPZ|nr:unnamed protein product [Heligmosomoides polygyrus]